MRLVAKLLLLFCVAVLHTSCQNDNPLVGIWRFESVEVVEGSSTRIPPTVVQMWESMKDNMRLELNGGGSFTSTLQVLAGVQAEPQEGTWTQSEDGKLLKLKHNGAETESVYTIAEQSEQRLKLLWASNDMVLVLVRVAE